MPETAAIDFFVVPTVTFRLLYGFIVLRHERREIVHCAVTANPSAEWTARQLTEAFPWDEAPRYLLRDREGIYGQQFLARVKAMEIEEVVSAPRSPWQNPYVERVIGYDSTGVSRSRDRAEQKPSTQAPQVVRRLLQRGSRSPVS